VSGVTKRPSWVPEGWRYTPSEKERRCDSCGHVTPAKGGSLTNPAGRHWPLVGNSGPGQDRSMVEAIVEANTAVLPAETDPGDHQ